MKTSIRWALLVLWMAAGIPAARADMTIEMKHNGTPQNIQVTDDKISMGMEDRGVIFRGDKNVLWIIDTPQKTYTEMTEEDARAMGEKVNDAMAQMKEAMKNMPPEQRAMMEKMMSGKMAQLKESKRTVTPLHQEKTINGFKCSGYKVEGEGDELEVWSADPKELKIKPEDMSAFKDFAAFMQSALPGMEQISDLVKDFDHPREDQVPGFPVLTIAKNKDGSEAWRNELVQVDHDKIPASAFELPEGLTKTKGLMQE